MALLLAGICLLLAACGAPIDAAPSQSALAEQTAETVQQSDPRAGLSASESFGTAAVSDGVRVQDNSVLYRTADSYRLEPNALDAAKAAFLESLSSPDNLQITQAMLWDCADDGDNTYYSVYLMGVYQIESGEKLDRGFFYDVGVRKADGSAFDSSDRLEEVLETYSIFRQIPESADDLPAADADDALEFAKQTAYSRLKNAKTGEIQSAAVVETDAQTQQIEVLGFGENGYGMQIPCVYTVYVSTQDGKIFEWNPAGDENIF